MKAAALRFSALRARLPIRVAPLLTGIIAVAALLVYGWSAWRGNAAPHSTVGIGFGIAAAVALVVVMLYSGRRALPAVRSLGPAQTYMQLHIWVGTLFVLLFLLHTGFRMPSGVLAWVLWSFSWWVVLTGLLGIVLQRSVPQVLAPASFEVHLQRVPELVDELRSRSEAALAGAEPRLRSWYDEELAWQLSAPRMVTAQVIAGGSTQHRHTGSVDLLRRTLDDRGVATLDELLAIQSTKHDLDVHFTLQRILRGWLYLHLPIAVALLVMVALHVFFILYF